jgi:peptide/nickel transport system substrate-binding protein
MAQLEKADNLNIVRYMNNGYSYIAFNFENPLFKDKKVRQALCYGLDRKGFVDSFFKGYAEVAHTPISPVIWAYPDVSKLNPYDYNPTKANQLLDEAGWKKNADGFRYKDGKKFTFTWTTYQGVEWAEKITALAKENWKLLGIDLKIEFLEFNSAVEKIRETQKFDMYNMAWGLGAEPDMSDIFSIKYSQKKGNNSGHYHNKQVEELMAKGIVTLDQEKRKEIYNELGKLFNDDLPYMFVYIRSNAWGVNKRVKNFHPSELIEWYTDIHLVDIEEKK